MLSSRFVLSEHTVFYDWLSGMWRCSAASVVMLVDSQSICKKKLSPFQVLMKFLLILTTSITVLWSLQASVLALKRLQLNLMSLLYNMGSSFSANTFYFETSNDQIAWLLWGTAVNLDSFYQCFNGAVEVHTWIYFNAKCGFIFT